ncbi:glutathione peroxidase [Marinibacterium profundimaris]|uniref:Glutathione peroxidase n=1 Tax=Marinibacterium profundimaris TaxID=1679460 RepID=A0A225NMT9_9RHOB|nr:glutathione peroxidase [Marinibacterium profundimaris]OWU75692.1 glutathione peroxidase [Marinibacterium profundimaris]
MLRLLFPGLLSLLTLFAPAAHAGGLTGTFASIDGGTLSLEDWRGRPVLVVNTASKCGFTYQYEGMQALYDSYRDRGLVVLAVPSDDFNQELGSAEEVKDFCELNYGLDFPMTDITHVTGAAAHPFYAAVRETSGFSPRWNFNKILLGPDGEIVATWRSGVRPESAQVTGVIEGLLN